MSAAESVKIGEQTRYMMKSTRPPVAAGTAARLSCITAEAANVVLGASPVRVEAGRCEDDEHAGEDEQDRFGDRLHHQDQPVLAGDAAEAADDRAAGVEGQPVHRSVVARSESASRVGVPFAGAWVACAIRSATRSATRRAMRAHSAVPSCSM